MAYAMTNKSGTLMSTGPTDTCKTQAGTAVVPTPYPNTAQMSAADSGTLSTKVTFDGSKAATIKTKVKTSSGDEMGTLGGIVSGKNMGECSFAKGSSKVSIEGKDAVRQGDATKHNGSPNNTVGTAISPSQSKVSAGG